MWNLSLEKIPINLQVRNFFTIKLLVQKSEFSHESELIRLIHFCEDAQEDDKDKEDRKNVHESQQETKPQPKDPAVEWTGRNSELGPRRVSSTFPDGDSEEEQCKSCSHFSHGGVYRQHLQAPIAPSIPPHSAQDTWSSCPSADRTRTGGLSPTAGPGFPISLQQHALVQVQGPPTNQWNTETLRTVFCLISS